MSRPEIRQWQPVLAEEQPPDLGALLAQVARGDHRAFELVKTRIRDGLIRMRDCMEVNW